MSRARWRAFPHAEPGVRPVEGLVARCAGRPARAQGTPAAPATSQSPGIYRFKIGGLTVTALHDGHLRRPALDRSLVRNVEPAELQAAARGSAVALHLAGDDAGAAERDGKTEGSGDKYAAPGIRTAANDVYIPEGAAQTG